MSRDWADDIANILGKDSQEGDDDKESIAKKLRNKEEFFRLNGRDTFFNVDWNSLKLGYNAAAESRDKIAQVLIDKVNELYNEVDADSKKKFKNKLGFILNEKI